MLKNTKFIIIVALVAVFALISPPVNSQAAPTSTSGYVVDDYFSIAYNNALKEIPEDIESDDDAYAYLLSKVSSIRFSSDGTIIFDIIDASLDHFEKNRVDSFIVRLNNLILLDAVYVSRDLKIHFVSEPKQKTAPLRVRSASILSEARAHAAELKAVYDNAIFHRYETAALYFAYRVRSGGAWDYKRFMGANTLYYLEDLGTNMTGESIGNFHYGYVGRAVFPAVVLKSAAGFYQLLSGTSSLDFMNSYFDDPADQAAIQKGIDKYESEH